MSAKNTRFVHFNFTQRNATLSHNICQFLNFSCPHDLFNKKIIRSHTDFSSICLSFPRIDDEKAFMFFFLFFCMQRRECDEIQC